MAEPTRNWLYEERQAFIVLRKAIQKKPWMVEELIKGLSEEMAYNILKQVGVELNRLLEVNRAFCAAAQALIKEKRSESTSTRQDDEGSSEHAPQGLLLRPAGPLPEDG